MAVVDNVIVGSGPAGVSTAFPLVVAGQHVHMFEAGMPTAGARPDRPSLAELRRGAGSCRDFLGADMRALKGRKEGSPKLRTLLCPDALSDYRERNGIRTENFTALGVAGVGGLSNVWGAAAPIWEEDDFAEYPLNRSDFLPSYRDVAKRCGVSGELGAIAPSSERIPVQPPPRRSEPLERLLHRAQRRGKTGGISITSASNMVITEPIGERQGCDDRGACLWGCPREAVYTSAFDLRGLIQYPNFTLEIGSTVDRIEVSDRGYRVYISTARGERSIEARRVFLAGGTIASSRLVMDLDSGLAQGLGMETTPCAAFAVWHPGSMGRPMSQRFFGMAQLALRVGLSDGRYAYGTLYSAEAVSAADLLARLPLTMRGGLKFLRSTLSSLSLGLLYLPGSFTRHRIWCEGERDGKKSRSIAIRGQYLETTNRVFRQVFRRIAKEFYKCGVVPIPGSLTPYNAGAEAHYGCTLPMGSLTSPNGELHGYPGLHVVDGSVLCSLPSKHQTFTMMANADRIAKAVVAGDV